MDVGSDMVGMVKTNTKLLYKDTIDNISKYWPGGSCLFLKINSTVPRVRPLISIGCKYNAREVISFIAA